MKHSKQYDNYWKFTLAWTDFNSKTFIDILSIIVNFIDNNHESYSEHKYKELQNIIHSYHNMAFESIRKGINQYVKMGFINFHLASYHYSTKAFLNASSDYERNILLSKIIFENSSFQRSVVNKSSSREINFLVRTIENNGSLLKSHIPAIMSVDLNNYPKEYITTQELNEICQSEDNIQFAKRKYNQISYLENLLKKLNSIYYDENLHQYRIKDSETILLEKYIPKKGRDPYSQQLYKEMLKQETKRVYTSNVPRCMVEDLPYPILIDSHIKPYSEFEPNEQFDANNGLLLSKNIDLLFDKFLISFDDNGNMLFSKQLHYDIKNFLITQKYHLKSSFLTQERCLYLAIHRSRLL